MATYRGTFTKGPSQDKAGLNVPWFITVSHPDWTNGVTSLGGSVLLHRSDTSAQIQAKYDELIQTLTQHARANRVPINGPKDFLTNLLSGPFRVQAVRPPQRPSRRGPA